MTGGFRSVFFCKKRSCKERGIEFHSLELNIARENRMVGTRSFPFFGFSLFSGAMLLFREE